ncbi:hypothetical protein [Actinoplanes sp. URMC 104]|uniref:hypothetical protein n=1 Tax=Actinoplanes sp. URMC 104 TaxID=3423409 RepID=UPI003F1A9CCA
MNDNQTNGHVKPRGRAPLDSVTAVYPVITLPLQAAPAEPAPEQQAPEQRPAGDALQVLTLAQRTAEEYIAAANLQARQQRAEAEVVVEQIRQDARAYAERVRAEADETLNGARMAAEAIAREAQAQASKIRMQAEKELADARAEAERIIAGGSKMAEQLEVRAQQRYEDAVGGLSVKRTALQEQIEALEVFDADYRRRLTAFLQGQLRALWTDRPQATDIPEAETPAPGGPANGARSA